MLTLIRVSQSKQGTFGVLLHDGTPFAVTLERPWQRNETDVSCIPPAEYLCQRVQSPSVGETFEVKGVDRRTHILFHWGNTLADTKGCILVAEEFGLVNGTPGVLASRRGFQELLDKLRGVDECLLVIREAFV